MKYMRDAKTNEQPTKSLAEEERTKLLVQMFEGHYFGELALIYGEPRNASVRATEEASGFTTKRGGFLPPTHSPIN